MNFYPFNPKHFLFFLSICLLASFVMSCHSSLNELEEEQKIARVLKQQENRWNNGSIEGFMDTYWKSDSLAFIDRNGLKLGWQTTLNNYLKSYPNRDSMGVLKFEILKNEVLAPDAAFVSGKWQLVRKEDKPSGYFTLILRKLNGEWKIVYDHSS